VLITTAYKNDSDQFKLFNFTEVNKYGSKYVVNKDDKLIGIGNDEKKTDNKTDTRIFGNLMAMLYQNYSHNLCNYPINSQYVRLIQTDPAFSLKEKDLIDGCNEITKLRRPDLKDIILHQKLLKIVLENNELQKKLTATLYHSKGLDLKYFEVKLKEIASGKLKLALEEHKKGIITKIGGIFTRASSPAP
jgi:hypothetical protein